jgi:hypothetical protein
MSRAIPPLLNTPSWRGAQLMQRDKFTFTCTLNKIRVHVQQQVESWFLYFNLKVFRGDGKSKDSEQKGSKNTPN